jgi:hypothetical protein
MAHRLIKFLRQLRVGISFMVLSLTPAPVVQRFARTSGPRVRRRRAARDAAGSPCVDRRPRGAGLDKFAKTRAEAFSPLVPVSRGK